MAKDTAEGKLFSVLSTLFFFLTGHNRANRSEWQEKAHTRPRYCAEDGRQGNRRRRLFHLNPRR